MFSLVTEEHKELEVSYNKVLKELFSKSREINFEKWREEKEQKEILEK